jgi:hypothetical protein
MHSRTQKERKEPRFLPLLLHLLSILLPDAASTPRGTGGKGIEKGRKALARPVAAGSPAPGHHSRSQTKRDSVVGAIKG